MSITATWKEDNTSGQTSSTATSINWGSTDEANLIPASHPIAAGNNSYTKYNYIQFTGTFTSVSDVKFAHTSGTLNTGCSVYGNITSTYNTPTTNSETGLTDISGITPITDGISMTLSPTGPSSTTDRSSECSSACFSQYIEHQLRTTSSASAGSSGSVVFTVQYQEN